MAEECGNIVTKLKIDLSSPKLNKDLNAWANVEGI